MVMYVTLLFDVTSVAMHFGDGVPRPGLRTRGLRVFLTVEKGGLKDFLAVKKGGQKLFWKNKKWGQKLFFIERKGGPLFIFPHQRGGQQLFSLIKF